MPKKATSKILSIETLYITTAAGQVVKRFARTLIDESGDKTRQIINSENKWEEVPESGFYEGVEETREKLITELSNPAKSEESEEEETEETKEE